MPNEIICIVLFVYIYFKYSDIHYWTKVTIISTLNIQIFILNKDHDHIYLNYSDIHYWIKDVGPDQIASLEIAWSWSALFAI